MDFRTVIREQRRELETAEKKEPWIERALQRRGIGLLNHPNIIVVLGVRRCGKSVLSYLLAKGHVFGYINFDDERLSGVRTEDLNVILEAMYKLYPDLDCIVLDEIHNIPGWELFANRLRRTKRVIITGSNSEMLSGELATKLTGRYIDMLLHPFSFVEVLRYHGMNVPAGLTTEEKARLLEALEIFLQSGGFPEGLRNGTGVPPRIYEDIIIKDILLRFGIKKKEGLRRLARYLISNSAQEVSYSKLMHILEIKNVHTISNWVSYLEQAFLIFKLERFDFKLKRQYIAPKKVYCVDNGIITAIGFTPTDAMSRLMENAVAIELQRRKVLDLHLEVYYWKDHQQREVDFVLKKGPKVQQLIQVTYASSKMEIRDRETSALLKASKELRCNDLLVLTWDYNDVLNLDGQKVTFTPLWAWLVGYNQTK